jgi:cyclophilin family peptidyl-prolyl cis-trans isomerase
MSLSRLALLLALVLGLAACGGDDEEEAAEPPAVAEGPCRQVEAPKPKADGGQAKPVGTLDAAKTYRLVVRTSCGEFTIELDQKSAPRTTASLVSLARNGFYDGTTFHRVVPGFVIQGGDPTGTGSGGPGYKFDDEPASNKYEIGTIAMANSGRNTNGSQFFICEGKSCTTLPPNYTAFGKVTTGQDIVTAIANVPRTIGSDGAQSKPATPVVISTITIVEE